MRWLHSLAKIHATFDDPKLASRADLVPVMPLAQLAGLDDLAGTQSAARRPVRVNAAAKVACPANVLALRHDVIM
jgi:hypothetical protein